ncbi:MAG: phosphate signaling complex protein PhoU [Phycisphaerae bacterium]|nr:phosphate signaling complex protein PhoU [Phycisphaerae bacterium]
MSELQHRLHTLTLRLDHMGMRVEQALVDALRALRKNDEQAGQAVDEHDPIIDREEVEIEQECIRLLALYQPAAIDLRTLCTIIKVNSDLERIADLAAGMGRRVKHLLTEKVSLDEYEEFDHLAQATTDILGRTVRMLSRSDVATAKNVIQMDDLIDKGYRHLVQAVLKQEDRRIGGAGAAMTVINLAKALERIGDHCTNIAEDIIFLQTGDIVRHAEAFEKKP